jgi:hypothetical protein
MNPSDLTIEHARIHNRELAAAAARSRRHRSPRPTIVRKRLSLGFSFARWTPRPGIDAART